MTSEAQRSPRRRVADDAGVHINFITDAGVDSKGGIFVRTRGASVTHALSALPGTGGRQLTAALLNRLHVNGGTWTSIATLQKQHYSSRRFLRWLRIEENLSDLSDPALTPAVAWRGVLAVGANAGQQRNFRTFIADALPSIRTDGETHRAALLGRALPTETFDLQGYAPEVADCIERVARAQVGDWFQRHRCAVRDALGSELPRDWLRVPATALVPGAMNQCPDQFRVTPRDLAAAMVLLCLLDDKGPNLSVIQSHTSDSVEASGDDAAFVTSVKARNRQVLRTPAPSGGLFSYGGLLQFVTAATRVERHMRDDGSDFSRLLFVPTGQGRAMNSQQVNQWWMTTRQDWPDLAVPRPTRLSFPRMRKSARLRGQQHGRILIGQSRSTARLYLADALPDVILIPGLLDTQNSVTDYWRTQTSPTKIDQEQADAAAVLKASPAVMDVGVAVCSTNGQSPTDPERPCGLGPAACFVCPNGYRTPEVIPGLLATIEFTGNIRKYEPTEWLTGEAPVLQTLAQKALDQFPNPMVAAASREDVANARALIACVYVEGRRRD